MVNRQDVYFQACAALTHSYVAPAATLQPLANCTDPSFTADSAGYVSWSTDAGSCKGQGKFSQQTIVPLSECYLRALLWPVTLLASHSITTVITILYPPLAATGQGGLNFTYKGGDPCQGSALGRHFSIVAHCDPSAKAEPASADITIDEPYGCFFTLTFKSSAACPVSTQLYTCYNNTCVKSASGVSQQTCESACGAPTLGYWKCVNNVCVTATSGVKDKSQCMVVCGNPVREPTLVPPWRQTQVNIIN
jgi:hypothetical protein